MYTVGGWESDEAFVLEKQYFLRNQPPLIELTKNTTLVCEIKSNDALRFSRSRVVGNTVQRNVHGYVALGTRNVQYSSWFCQTRVSAVARLGLVVSPRLRVREFFRKKKKFYALLKS